MAFEVFSVENDSLLKNSFRYEEDFLTFSEYQNFNPSFFPNLESFFKNNHPIAIEYCSGNGFWIVDQALKNPMINWIAVEKRKIRAEKILKRKRAHRLTNLLVIHGEALKFTKYFVKKETIQDVYINFPDPWPKNKHAKYRLLNKEFVDQIFFILKPQSKITFVTDDKNYFANALSIFLSAANQFTADFPSPYFLESLENYGTSFFEEFWRKQNKTIHYCKFTKCV